MLVQDSNTALLCLVIRDEIINATSGRAIIVWESSPVLELLIRSTKRERSCACNRPIRNIIPFTRARARACARGVDENKREKRGRIKGYVEGPYNAGMTTYPEVCLCTGAENAGDTSLPFCLVRIVCTECTFFTINSSQPDTDCGTGRIWWCRLEAGRFLIENSVPVRYSYTMYYNNTPGGGL